MLPPLDPNIATANPKFEMLYQDLTTVKLHEDGTSKLDAKAQKEREALSEELQKARVESARRTLIKNGLRNLAYNPDGLPEELQELVAVAAAMLEGQIAEDDRLLLQDDLLTLKNNITSISTALSKTLYQDLRLVAGMLDPEDRPAVEELPTAISKLKDSIATARAAGAASRLALGHEVAALHSLYRQVMETSIRILEQTIHGSVARGTKTKADYLATVAEGMSKKLELQHGQLVSQLYSEDVQEALSSRSELLAKEASSLKVKVREAEGKLEEYQRTSGMKVMAVEFAEIMRESDRVKREIERLEGGSE